jgi:hypothetical protein
MSVCLSVLGAHRLSEQARELAERRLAERRLAEQDELA